MKNKAGNDSQIPSLSFILTITPININIANPPEEISKINGNLRPVSKPNAPNNCKTATSFPAFSKPKRLNSLCMWGLVK